MVRVSVQYFAHFCCFYYRQKNFIYFRYMFCVIYMNKWFSDTLYFMEMFFSDVFTLTVLVIFCYINTSSKLHDLKWWPLIHSLVLVFFFMLTEVIMKYSVERWAGLYNHSRQVPRWCTLPLIYSQILPLSHAPSHW